MPPRPYILHETNFRDLKAHAPTLAILPWGATESHNYHLPHGTDVIEAAIVAERSASLACERGAKVIVLPAIPFGNNAQQQDQVATVHLSTSTALAILSDVARSLVRQKIDRLVLLNAHGGNDFKPMIRDVQLQTGILIVLVNFWQLCIKETADIFPDAGDHAGDLETSFILHTNPDWVKMDQAGPGETVPFALSSLKQPGVWTPRPWSACHPDTGCGNPAAATADKGKRYVQIVAERVAGILVDLSAAKKGQLPYI